MIDPTLNATLVSREDLHPELIVIKVRPDSGAIQSFKPGQFCTLGLPPAETPDETGKRRPRLVRRAYSIASSPNEPDHLEIFIVLVEDGRFTPMLWEVQQGDKIWMDEKIRGEFTLDTIPDGKDLVMVSTGTGLAPFISMLRTYRGTDRWRRLVMIHGVRYAKDLGYKEELEQIAAEDESVIYIPACTREPDDSPWAGHRGRVNTILDDPAIFRKYAGFDMNPDDCHLMLCGNPDMIKAAQATFEGQGWTTHTRKQEGNLHFERYW